MNVINIEDNHKLISSIASRNTRNHKNFAEGIYSSCKKVESIPGMKAIDLLCGNFFLKEPTEEGHRRPKILSEVIISICTIHLIIK